jgi:hypothetical protein
LIGIGQQLGFVHESFGVREISLHQGEAARRVGERFGAFVRRGHATDALDLT